MERPEPFLLTGGQRRLIVAALSLVQDLCESLLVIATDKHQRWKLGLRIRQCKQATRLMESSREDREARAAAKARRISDRSK